MILVRRSIAILALVGLAAVLGTWSSGLEAGAQTGGDPTPTPTPTPEGPDDPIDPRSVVGHEDGEHQHGLGEYGSSGPILREHLQPGLAESVSDEALRAAQSDELRTARSNWHAPIDFVGQVDYQLKFRSQNDYMSVELAHIGGILERQPNNIGISGLGLYLTDAEAAEFERRIELGDQIPRPLTAIGELQAGSVPEGVDPIYSSNFGGIWQDQFDGGAIVVAFVDAARVDLDGLVRIVGGEQNLRVLDGHPSWSEVNGWRDDLLQALVEMKIPASVAIDSTSEGRRIRVTTPDIEAFPERLLAVAREDLIGVEEGPIDEPAGDPTNTHGAGSQMPGLQIEFDPGGNCTWGVNGNNDIDHYIMTAGHCSSPPYENFVGWTDTMEVHQNNSHHLTDGYRYVISEYGFNVDAKGVSSGYANDNCYHWGHCQKHIANRAWHNSWEINSDVTCASLATTNQFRCGYILEENYSTTAADCAGNTWLRVGMGVTNGDSGAAGIDQGATATTFDAILHCNKGSSESTWMTAFKFKLETGLDANCYPTVTSFYSPSSWPTCAAINR